MNANIISILKAINTENDTIVNNETWTALFEALAEAESDRLTLEVDEDKAHEVWAKRYHEADYDEEHNDEDYNLCVRAGNASRKAEAARKVEAIIVKAIEDIYRESYVEIEEEA